MLECLINSLTFLLVIYMFASLFICLLVRLTGCLSVLRFFVLLHFYKLRLLACCCFFCLFDWCVIDFLDICKMCSLITYSEIIVSFSFIICVVDNLFTYRFISSIILKAFIYAKVVWFGYFPFSIKGFNVLWFHD